MNRKELEEYQLAAFATAIYPGAGSGNSLYPYYALCEEAGEVAGLYAKRIRDGERPDFRDKLRKELGDVLWQCAAVATENSDRLHVGLVFGIRHPIIAMCQFASTYDIGRVMAYVKMVAEENGMTLKEIADANLAKLASRAERGTLSGSGDDR